MNKKTKTPTISSIFVIIFICLLLTLIPVISPTFTLLKNVAYIIIIGLTTVFLVNIGMKKLSSTHIGALRKALILLGIIGFALYLGLLLSKYLFS